MQGPHRKPQLGSEQRSGVIWLNLKRFSPIFLVLCEKLDDVLYSGTCRGKETSEAIVAVPCAKDGDSDLRSSSGKCLDLGYILKVEPAEYALSLCAR